MATVGQHCASKQIEPVQLNTNQCLLEPPLAVCLLVKRVIDKIAKKKKGETQNRDDSSCPLQVYPKRHGKIHCMTTICWTRCWMQKIDKQ